MRSCSFDFSGCWDIGAVRCVRACVRACMHVVGEVGHIPSRFQPHGSARQPLHPYQTGNCPSPLSLLPVRDYFRITLEAQPLDAVFPPYPLRDLRLQQGDMTGKEGLTAPSFKSQQSLR